MLSHMLAKGLTSLLIGLATLDIATTSSLAAIDDLNLDETSMSQAIRYLGVLRGRDISADDEAWLKEQWAKEHEASPQAVAAQLDELAFQFERHQQGKDPITLASGRTEVAENAYCAAEQTSDPTRHRLRDILAPDDFIVAADCLLGLVVTRFDIDGLVASQALTAAATARDHDAASDRAEIIGIIEEGFSDAAPSEKALLTNGELRHAVLARFWSRIDGTPEQRAVIEELRSQAATDIRGPSRQLESLALSRLGEVDYLAKVGDATLTAAAFGIYTEWLERIAGYSFSSRDRAWLEQAIIEEFQENPEKLLSEVSGIKGMNTDYHTTEGAEAKNDLVASWAADLHCYLTASSDPDEIRLAEVIFDQDPVTEADCQAGRISRKRHAVVAEAKGQRLLEHDLAASFRFVRMILGRPLLSEEVTVIREDDIQSFKQDPGAWREQNGQYRTILEKTEDRGKNAFLAMDDRKKLFDTIYCAMRESDDPYADDYLRMFQRGDAIVFEDCDRKLVTTRDEIDAIISFVNFLTLLNERQPLSPAEVKEVRQSLKAEDLDDAESSMFAVNEWWSLLTLEEKAAEILKVQKNGVTPEADGDTIGGFVRLAKLQVVLKNAKLDQCRMMAVIARGNANIFAAKQGRYFLNEGGDPVGFPGQEYATLVTTNNMFAELCSQ